MGASPPKVSYEVMVKLLAREAVILRVQLGKDLLLSSLMVAGGFDSEGLISLPLIG